MNDIANYLWEQLQNNNFLSGGAVLMALGAVAALLRKVPGQIWAWIKSRCMVEIDIPDRDVAFNWVNDWLAAHPYGASRARLLTVRTVREESGPTAIGDTTGRSLPKIILSPAPGYHYFFYKRRLVMLHREREDKSNNTFQGFKETFNLKMIGRNRQLAMTLLEEARELAYPPEDQRLTLFTVHYDEWKATSRLRPRPIESVIWPAGVMESLIAAVVEFQKSEAYYLDRGIPYRLGILASGSPGSGKSSGALALASYFKKDIATLNLNRPDLNDEELRNLIVDVPKTSILLIEDIDCVFDHKRDAKEGKKNSVTFSGLLNAIDGVAAGEGRILVMTTNYPDRLDPALIRPGRADVHLAIGWPTAEQRARLFKRFHQNDALAEQFANAIGDNISMAQLQGHLLAHRADAEEAVRTAHNLIPLTQETPENVEAVRI